jgi:hypothetical protein
MMKTRLTFAATVLSLVLTVPAHAVPVSVLSGVSSATLQATFASLSTTAVSSFNGNNVSAARRSSVAEWWTQVAPDSRPIPALLRAR